MQIVIESYIFENVMPQFGHMVLRHRYSEIVTALNTDFEGVTSMPVKSLLATNSSANLIVLGSADFG
tara:strand:+ start:181 stop:381 length:201 start_codon:yes stop_codon:yes gene_type:complete